jgi:hypothetical protein
MSSWVAGGARIISSEGGDAMRRLARAAAANPWVRRSRGKRKQREVKKEWR